MSQRYIGGLIHNAPGGWSAKFSGSNYLSVAANAAFNFGSGDFTIEFWAYSTSTSRQIIIGNYSSSGATYGWAVQININSTGDLFLGWGNATVSNPSGVWTANQWNHVAIARSGTTTKIFVNGVQASSVTDSTNYNNGNNLVIGRNADLAQTAFWFSGYVSNVRVVKGTAVYTSAFTPPTGALLPITNTQLLTCRYPTIVDGSTNAFTITNNSTVLVDTSNPFPTSVLPNPALGVAGNGIYTLSQYEDLLTANQWPSYDPYYKNVTLNLHGNPIAGSTFVTDISTNNFQVTAVGNAQASGYTPFQGNGYYSNYFDGTGDYLTTATGVGVLGSNDFSIEAWVYVASQTNQTVMNGQTDRATTTGSSYTFNIGPSATPAVYIGGSSYAVTGPNPSTNTWSHVVFCRTGGTLSTYLNGTRVGTRSDLSTGSVNTGSTTYPPAIGANGNGDLLTGYISNVRRIIGSGGYDATQSTITVPTSPLTVTANTNLLTCQSNRFVDNSTNAFALTVNGDTAIRPLQPFTNPTDTSLYGSGLFDGSGDYLTLSSQNVLPTTTQNFTVEFWAYKTSAWSTANQYFCNSNASGGLQIWVNTGSSVLRLGAYGVAPVLDYSYSSLQINTWTHIAYSRSGNSFALWVNGTRVATTTSSQSFGSSPTITTIGGSETGSDAFGGYISNFRVVRSAFVYDPASTTITVPTSPLTAISGTSLLTVQTNAQSQNNTFIDSSPNNYALTVTSTVTQGSFTPYITNGYWSNNFNGSSGVTVSSTSSQFGFTGDFTWEAWINPSALPSSGGNYSIICSRGSVASNSAFQFLFGNSSGTYQITGTISIGSSDSNLTWNIPTTPSIGTWYHVAMVRSGIMVNVYWNGSAIGAGQTASGTTNTPTVNPTIGFRGGSYNDLFFNGYISNFRMVGSALYTSNFTPDTAPLTAISGTRLLACQSNRLLDNSTNAFTLTAYSAPTSQVFQPFRLLAPYTSTAFGGSGYFDGGSSSLKTPSGTCPVINNFSACGWVYRTSVPGTQQTFIALGLDGPGRVGFFWTGSNFEYNIYGSSTVTIDGSGSMPYGVWTYVVLTRTGSTITLYYNGVLKATVTQGTAFSASSGRAMMWMEGTYGYATNLRFDTAAHPSPTTVPTAPVSYTANTNNLLNFTNAGIYDNAMVNDLVTVGNSQISTSVKKYGSGSLYFDGTGDRLISPANIVMDLSAGNFTVECWIYTNTTSGAHSVAYRGLASGITSGSELQWGIYQSGTSLIVRPYSSSTDYSINVGTITSGVWYHVALVRSGSTFMGFLNGVKSSTTQTISGSLNNNTAWYGVIVGLAALTTGDEAWNGYIDDLRITKGVARYTANFTPPTSQLQDQ